ncbi:MAG TPA: aspartate aminotransferase family protein [Bacillota bacterium]|nr:aspartate aminotransferase family protein [Bacillota bacterium]HOK68340.1 aspartate aminotransferase family protein [Bacillota bacterium]HPP85250.1 aspartate aminotransferase family protein [Bacillota bacterium]
MNILDELSQNIAPSYARFPVAIARGRGSLLYDIDGKEYIDLGSGIAVNAFGACDEEWIKAVTAQLGQIAHTSNLYYSLPQARLARLLCARTHFKKVFFSNSGAEANECAIKAARKYSADKYGEGRSRIVTLKNSFHGRTITTLSATGQDGFHKHFGPFTEGFAYAEANNYEDTASKLSDDCAALMIELIQGEGGINVLEKDYVANLAKMCKEKDILFIIDEVQTGNGRTGKLFCYEHYGIEPDIVTTAKGLGGGLPIGCTLFNEKTAEVLAPGTHGSTFGGNPICAAGAISIIERLTDELFAEVNKKSEYLKTTLSALKNVTQVAGMGLMLGIKTAKDPKEVANECIKKGVLVLTAKDKVRLLPALNIPFDVLKKGVAILSEVIEQ